MFQKRVLKNLWDQSDTSLLLAQSATGKYFQTSHWLAYIRPACLAASRPEPGWAWAIIWTTCSDRNWLETGWDQVGLARIETGSRPVGIKLAKLRFFGQNIFGPESTSNLGPHIWPVKNHDRAEQKLLPGLWRDRDVRRSTLIIFGRNALEH